MEKYIDNKLNIKVKVLNMRNKEFINYTYIVIDEKSKECVIIDPAWEIDKIINYINNRNLEVKGIFLTHSHYDHVNLVDNLIKSYNCSIFVGMEEIEYYNFICDNVYPILDLQIINLGSIKVKCIYTPGHTKGSYCFLINNNLFTGDTLFIEGCGNCNEKGGEPAELFRSLKKLKVLVKDECLIYPGHAFNLFPGESFKEVKNKNIYLQIISEIIFIKLITRQRKNILKYI